MIKILAAFSGFSVDNIDKAKQFYSEILGLEVEDSVGGTYIKLSSKIIGWMYLKNEHKPATYTTFDIVVDNIDDCVNELVKKGVVFERYPGSSQDEKGILRGKEQGRGPNIAWLKDPAGNILALIEA